MKITEIEKLPQLMCLSRDGKPTVHFFQVVGEAWVSYDVVENWNSHETKITTRGTELLKIEAALCVHTKRLRDVLAMSTVLLKLQQMSSKNMVKRTSWNTTKREHNITVTGQYQRTLNMRVNYLLDSKNNRVRISNFERPSRWCWYFAESRNSATHQAKGQTDATEFTQKTTRRCAFLTDDNENKVLKICRSCQDLAALTSWKHSELAPASPRLLTREQLKAWRHGKVVACDTARCCDNSGRAPAQPSSSLQVQLLRLLLLKIHVSKLEQTKPEESSCSNIPQTKDPRRDIDLETNHECHTANAAVLSGRVRRGKDEMREKNGQDCEWYWGNGGWTAPSSTRSRGFITRSRREWNTAEQDIESNYADCRVLLRAERGDAKSKGGVEAIHFIVNLIVC